MNQTGWFGTTASDADGDTVQYFVDWNYDGNADESSPYVSSGQTYYFYHSWPTSGTKWVRFIARDNHGNWSSWVWHSLYVNGSPTLWASGSTSLSLNEYGWYGAVASDPDGDQVRYYVDWNYDGNAEAVSPFVPSGQTYYFYHSWPDAGTKWMRFIAQDSKGNWSSWVPWSTNVYAPIPGVCANNLSFCPGTTLNPAIPGPPTPGLCSAGNPATITGNSSGPWSWVCNGLYGGTPSGTCNASIATNNVSTRTIQKVCKGTDFPYNNSSVNALCVNATSVNFSQTSDNASWTCNQGNCGYTASTSITKKDPLVPACGADNGAKFCTDKEPESLCSSGTHSTPSYNSGTGMWEWTCTGECPATVINCSAQGKKFCGWIETN
jgi:hypothetical protein